MTLSLLDATVLSNFAHVQRPELVRAALGEQAATTPTVLAELRQGEALGLVPRVNWRWLPVLALTAAEQALAGQYQEILDAGEVECLAVAVTRQGRFFSDYLAARRLAQAKQVPLSGTIGLLLALIRSRKLTIAVADGLLAVMKEQGYRAPVASLQVYFEES
jgi:predicted nucleic acid-binding protein